VGPDDAVEAIRHWRFGSFNFNPAFLIKLVANAPDESFGELRCSVGAELDDLFRIEDIHLAGPGKAVHHPARKGEDWHGTDRLTNGAGKPLGQRVRVV